MTIEASIGVPAPWHPNYLSHRPDSRKGRALLRVTAELFVEMLKERKDFFHRTFSVVEHALPTDASLVRIIPANEYEIFLELESNAFPPLVPAGYHDGMPVIHSPVCRVEYNEAPSA